MEVDGGIMEGVSARLCGARASCGGASNSTSLVPSPRCSAGRPDPQGLHRPELPPGSPLARAEDPGRPQHAGPQVSGAGGDGGGSLGRGYGSPEIGAWVVGRRRHRAAFRVQPSPFFSVHRAGFKLFLGPVEIG